VSIPKAIVEISLDRLLYGLKVRSGRVFSSISFLKMKKEESLALNTLL
jgi:hypothetical protein